MKLLLQIQEFFTCGNIVSKNNRSEASFRVNSLHDLINFIIPRGAARPLAKAASRCLQPGLPPAHFKEYQLMTQKRADFILFNSIIDKIIQKEHLTMVGFCEILAIKSQLNLGLTPELLEILHKNQVESPLKR